MNEFKNRIKKNPLVAEFLRKRNKKRFLKNNFKTEMALLNKADTNLNKQQSILHFSFNKAASQYTKTVMRSCGRDIGMKAVGFLEYAFHTEFPYLYSLTEEELKKIEHIFKTKGYLYSVMGQMVNVPNINDYRIVFMTRDPRDMLVSSYYSIAYSHTPPPKDSNKYLPFMRGRKEALSMSIDEYVIEKTEGLLSVFNSYSNELVNISGSNLLICDFKDMVLDFESWFKNILNHCELNISITLYKNIINSNHKLREKHKNENINNQMRKGIHGDYKLKLESKTVDALNKKFEKIIVDYNYEF